MYLFCCATNRKLITFVIHIGNTALTNVFLDNSYFHLFMWSIYTSKIELAKTIWRKTNIIICYLNLLVIRFVFTLQEKIQYYYCIWNTVQLNTVQLNFNSYDRLTFFRIWLHRLWSPRWCSERWLRAPIRVIARTSKKDSSVHQLIHLIFSYSKLSVCSSTRGVARILFLWGTNNKQNFQWRRQNFGS